MAWTRWRRSIGAVSSVLLGCALSALSACGQGADSAPERPSPSPSDTAILDALNASNIRFVPQGRPEGTWRWQGSPHPVIPVYAPTPPAGDVALAAEDAKVRAAVATVNAKLVGRVRLDLVSAPPAQGNYIHISYGTSYVPKGETNYQAYCGNVATAPNVGDMILPDARNAVGSQPVHLNLGNGRCITSAEMVAHEFGHALGLASHFPGFGDPGPDALFWDVLATLYGNPPSTPRDQLRVQRIAP